MGTLAKSMGLRHNRSPVRRRRYHAEKHHTLQQKDRPKILRLGRMSAIDRTDRAGSEILIYVYS